MVHGAAAQSCYDNMPMNEQSRKMNARSTASFKQLFCFITSMACSMATSDAFTIQNCIQNHGRQLSLHSTAATTQDLSLQQEDIPQTSFVSRPMQTYMEDIDMYSVMWHVNYLKSYDRAIHSSVPKGEQCKTTVLDHEDWSIIQVNKQKFKNALRLGDTYRIQGKLLDRTDDVLDVWEVTMYCTENPSLIYNTAQLTIARPTSDVNNATNQDWIPLPEPYTADIFGSNVCEAHRDEFDRHLESHLPLSSSLNHMERSRTNALGGPTMLRKLKEENNLVFFVISMDGISLVRMEDKCCRPGDKIISDISVTTKKKGMITEIYHTLSLQSDSGAEPVRLAQAKVTLMTFNELEGKPTWKLPEWFKKRLGIQQ